MVSLGGHLSQFFGAVGTRHSSTCVNCALEAFLLTYLIFDISGSSGVKQVL